jgi:hypothetical protein
MKGVVKNEEGWETGRVREKRRMNWNFIIVFEGWPDISTARQKWLSFSQSCFESDSDALQSYRTQTTQRRLETRTHMDWLAAISFIFLLLLVQKKKGTESDFYEFYHFL